MVRLIIHLRIPEMVQLDDKSRSQYSALDSYSFPPPDCVLALMGAFRGRLTE